MLGAGEHTRTLTIATTLRRYTRTLVITLPHRGPPQRDEGSTISIVQGGTHDKDKCGCAAWSGVEWCGAQLVGNGLLSHLQDVLCAVSVSHYIP